MKKIILIFFVLLGTFAYASATERDVVETMPAEATVNENETTTTKNAEILYSEGKYSEALEIYNAVLEGGQESAALYYNIANCYFKLGYNTKAIINYERSLLINPSDNMVRYNLQMAERAIVDKFEVLPEVFFVRWYKNIVSYLSVDEWAMVSVVLFIVLLILLALFIYSGLMWLKKNAFFGGILASFAMIFSVMFAIQQNRKLVNREFAIVTNPSVTIKGSPDKSGTDLFLIHEGLKVRITDELGAWCNIVLLDGNEGWIEKNDIERI